MIDVGKVRQRNDNEGAGYVTLSRLDRLSGKVVQDTRIPIGKLRCHTLRDNDQAEMIAARDS